MNDRGNNAVFAILTPANAYAKLAFSDVYDNLVGTRQEERPNTGSISRMTVYAEQHYDGDVLRLKRELAANSLKINEGDSSESATEPDSATERELRDEGMIWTGSYDLSFQSQPSNPSLGWTLGYGRAGHDPSFSEVDIVLCTKPFARKCGINIRKLHARFNFAATNRALCIAAFSRSQMYPVSANGKMVTRELFAMNQHRMEIGIDKLSFVLQYTEFAASSTFQQIRQLYQERFAVTSGGTAICPVDFDMPTPLPGTRTFGQWTLGEPLGRGGMGRVFLASNSRNDMCAVKLVERTQRTAASVDAEISTNRRVTSMAERWDAEGRVIRQIEVLFPDGEAFGAAHSRNNNTSTSFDGVAIILQPMVPRTFCNLVHEARRDGGAKGMPLERAAAFRDALMALQVFHKQGWIHRDIKPANIGVVGKKPARSVLLDVGTATCLDCNGRGSSGATLPPTPGRGGTVGYLAPERELENHSHAIDIWALAVVGFELTYGYHPWKFAVNPWRRGQEYEDLRQSFVSNYGNAMALLARDGERVRLSPTNGYLHLGDLLIQMLRYPSAPDNNLHRIDIDTALDHPAWGPLSEGAPSRTKRSRVGTECGGA